MRHHGNSSPEPLPLRGRRRWAVAVATAVVVGLASGATSVATASTRPSQSTASSSASCPAARWHTPPITVTRHFRVPPTPVIKAVRAGKHLRCHFDRLVLDITVRNPGYHIQFVRQVIADPSGKTIKLPGRRFLLITLRPAQAHKSSGASTLPTKVQVLGLPMLKAWVLAGDFEGVVSIAVGLRAKTSIRVGELRGRLFIDFKY